MGGKESGYLWLVTDWSRCSHWYEHLLVLQLGPWNPDPSLCPQAHELPVSSMGAGDGFPLDSSSHMGVNPAIGSACFSRLKQLRVIESVHLFWLEQKVRSAVRKATASLTSSKKPSPGTVCLCREMGVCSHRPCIPSHPNPRAEQPRAPQWWAAPHFLHTAQFQNLPRYQHGQSYPQEGASFLKHVWKMMGFLFP